MIIIRPTIEQDAEILCAIQKQAFEPLYERYHDEGNPFLRGTEDILKRLDTPFFRYFTILEDGKIVGGISYKCMGRVPFLDELKKGECYLQRVYIKPERQCNRIAQTAPPAPASSRRMYSSFRSAQTTWMYMPLRPYWKSLLPRGKVLHRKAQTVLLQPDERLPEYNP